MTKETLAFARGERTIWIRKVYVYKFFEEAAEQLRRELEPRGIALDLRLEERGTAYFDETKVLRALHNLARNAAEAISATRGLEGRCVLTVSRGSNGALCIAFSDNGPGVPEEIRSRLFESFTTHGKQGGTGLGLAIVHSIVSDHGGSIAVESQPGLTTFRIELPQDEAHEASSSGTTRASVH